MNRSSLYRIRLEERNSIPSLFYIFPLVIGDARSPLESSRLNLSKSIYSRSVGEMRSSFSPSLG